eukprot:TRINITY_DN33062_c0_g1_i1.p1 TRINITY_DN33062_c0_g1~~TRINITY_DN33062_c0_g1_i1.p1  ORF type:complete len:691 (-),score=91.55 TRINITY_DN33062_c0_g1_i1:566-2542(-)
MHVAATTPSRSSRISRAVLPTKASPSAHGSKVKATPLSLGCEASQGYPQANLQTHPATPQVARILALSPEAAPTLAASVAAAVASSAGYPPALEGASSAVDHTVPSPQEAEDAVCGAVGGRSLAVCGGGRGAGSPAVAASASAGILDRERQVGSSRLLARSLASAQSVTSPGGARRIATGRSGERPAELTAAEVLRASEGDESLADIVQVLYRHGGLTSIRTPSSVDFCELVSLRVLSLSHNLLTDIGPVADLPCLVELNVNNNKIQDLCPAFECESLEVLLASSNCISSLEGVEALQRLRHLSLFANELSKLSDFCASLAALPELQMLDLGANPCFGEPSNRCSLIRELPRLRVLDGDILRQVDRQMACEFFDCAEELGFQTQEAARPKTAPASASSTAVLSVAPSRCPRGPSPASSRRNVGGVGQTGGSSPKVGLRRDRSASRGRLPGIASSVSCASLEVDLAAPEVDPADTVGSIQRFTSHVESLRLRMQTSQVECENLRNQIRELRDREPIMGVATLQARVAELEAENRKMYERVEENQRLRERLHAEQEELADRRRALGLSEAPPPRPLSRQGSAIARPRSALGSRPGSAAAAAEAIMECSLLSRAAEEAELKARNRKLRDAIASAIESVPLCCNETVEAARGRPPSSYVTSF